MNAHNRFGQPIGEPLHDWSPPEALSAREIDGRYCRLVPLSPGHGPALFVAFSEADDSLWTYMGIGPFLSAGEVSDSIASMVALPGWIPFAVFVDNDPLGFLSYLRMNPPEATIEIGSIVYSPRLQRTRAATETIFLLIDHAFSSGYRRVEWKCDDLNEPSRRAAIRLGFNYEGTFRQATHYKGRNRDTAWYAITDQHWAEIKYAFEAWLAPGNFDGSGNQIRSLEASESQPPTLQNG